MALNIWPPSERTRAAVVERMATTLSCPSVLSNKYGQIESEQASIIAKRIEEEAFMASQGLEASEAGQNGAHMLQFYSKQISKLMLGAAKNQASNQNSAQCNNASADLPGEVSNPHPQVSDS